MSGRLVLLALLFVGCVALPSDIGHEIIQFSTFNGKESDPCHVGLTYVNPDCAYPQRPDSSVTVLVPARSSVNPIVNNFFNGGALFTVSLNGRYLQGTNQRTLQFGAADSTVKWFALSTMAGRCASTDASLGAARVLTGLGPAADGAASTSPTRVSFEVPQEWMSVKLELEAEPRALCYSTYTGPAANQPPATGLAGFSRWIYTGYKWRVVWACQNDAGAGALSCPPPVSNTLALGKIRPVAGAAVGNRHLCLDYSSGALNDLTGFPNGAPVKTCLPGGGRTNCPDIAANQVAGAPIIECPTSAALYGQWPMNDTLIQVRNAQTRCCLGAGGALGWAIGQCFNPNTQTCCSGNTANTARERCCNPANSNIQWMDAPCPCGRTGAAQTCPTGETCCLPTKYPELNTAAFALQTGECYDTRKHQCCDTGKRFDPGSQQCCVINGLQSLDVPCPCATNAHCRGQMFPEDDANFACCQQSNPVPWERPQQVAGCNIYANYPNGTGAADSQTCLGRCINTNYQICCNGASCLLNTEYCCNSTCCNKYVGTCRTGRRSGSPGQWNNFDGFGQEFLQCSTIEQMNTIKAFWIFVLPTELMFASFLGLAIALAFAARAKDSHEYAWIERIMVGIGILTILFAITLFFAPVYKYGIVLVIASLVSILTAAARVRWLNGLCILVLLVAIFYMYDFVHGNFLLNVSSGRNLPDGIVDPSTSGVLHATRKMFSSVRDVQAQEYCTKYYNYFKFDPQIRDSERFDNPDVTTFGYCSRAWVVALYLFEAAAMNLIIVQFFLALLSLAIRFQAVNRDPMLTEVDK